MKTKRKRKTNILRQWLVAHKHNDHRPHLTRSKSLLVIMVLILGIQFFGNLIIAKKPSVLGYATDINAGTIVSLTNSYRSGGGLGALTANQALNNAAFAKANDMLSSQYWAHNNPNGTTPWYFFNAAGYSYSYAGENLAKDFNTSAGVLSGWMNSPGHRANIMNSNYIHIGVAVVNGTLLGSQTTIVVALYGTPAGYSPAPPPPPPAPATQQNTQDSKSTTEAQNGNQLNKDLNLVKELDKNTGGFVTISTPKKSVNYKERFPNLNLILSSSNWPVKIIILILISVATVMMGEAIARARNKVHHDRHFVQPLAQASLIIVAIIVLGYSLLGNVL